MEVTEEKRQFFINHKDEIGQLIEKFNARRIRAGADPLTEDEIDQGVEEMMELASSGGNIMTYRFPIPEGPIRRVEPVKPNGSKYTFDITKCANGFIMNVAGKEAFIFKSPGELLDILKEALFEDDRKD